MGFIKIVSQMYKKFSNSIISLCLIACLVFSLGACKQVDLYERLENVPKSEWQSSFQPSFTFNISDTISLYDVFITIRHTNNYAYNNIWLEPTLQLPGDSATTQQTELHLANNDGWIGTGMDDIFETRAKVTATPQHFKRSGPVTIKLKQIMRVDPLPGILQVGVRVERVGKKEPNS